MSQDGAGKLVGLLPKTISALSAKPSIETIMRILLGSQDAAKDREAFYTAQVLSWLLAAPDGHAKNFSVFIGLGGRIRLPAYTTACPPIS